MQQPLRVPLKSLYVILAPVVTSRKREGGSRDQTECFADLNTGVCLECGLKGRNYDAGV